MTTAAFDRQLAELDRWFEQFPDKMMMPVLRGGVRAAARVLADAAKANAPRASGDLAKAIGVMSTRVDPVSGQVLGGVKVYAHGRKATRHGFLGPIYEFGGMGTPAGEARTSRGRRRSTKVKRFEVGGTVRFGRFPAIPYRPAQPFLRPALDLRGGDAGQAFNAYVLGRLARRDFSPPSEDGEG